MSARDDRDRALRVFALVHLGKLDEATMLLEAYGFLRQSRGHEEGARSGGAYRKALEHVLANAHFDPSKRALAASFDLNEVNDSDSEACDAIHEVVRSLNPVPKPGDFKPGGPSNPLP